MLGRNLVPFLRNSLVLLLPILISIFTKINYAIPATCLLVGIFSFYYANKNLTSFFDFLIPVSVTFVMYVFFFRIAEFVWARNLIVDPGTLTSWVRAWYLQPRDGIEVYVLYTMTILMILSSVALYFIWNRISVTYKSSTLYFIILVLSYMFIRFVKKVGWNTPYPTIHPTHSYVLLLLAMSAILVTILIYANRFNSLKNWLLPILLIPVCFIPIGDPLSISNYTFILTPTLRIISGVPFKELYLQYDLLLSLLSLPFLLFKVNLIYIRMLAQFSFYLLFIGVFYYARMWLKSTNVLYCMVLTIITVKIYGLICDPTFVFQVSPIRLDLWLIPLLFIYFLGINHFIIAIVLGFLLLLHKTFGIIYIMAYYQSYLFIEMLNLRSWKEIILVLKKARINFFIISAFFVCSLLIYGNGGLSDAAVIYQKLGIGFDRTQPVSFFWYIPLLLGTATLLLIKNRKSLGEKYFANGILLVFFSCGNLLYFFGRSHENNLINISAILLIDLFLIIDILYSQSDSKTQKLNWVIPFLVLIFVVQNYSGSIIGRMHEQYSRVKSGHIYNEGNFDFDFDFAQLNVITNSSKKIFVLIEDIDFLFYYHGDLVPPSYFSPYTSWADKKSLISYTQGLIDQGYYIIAPNAKGEIASELKYDHLQAMGKYSIISKKSVMRLQKL